jgi:acyl-CoA oxidase
MINDQVSPQGVYSKQDGAEKVAFGIMLDVRARICVNSAYVLARALTISIRYSCVRMQGYIDNGVKGGKPLERAVIEYPTQQKVLMSLLSLAYALHFTGIIDIFLYLCFFGWSVWKRIKVLYRFWTPCRCNFYISKHQYDHHFIGVMVKESYVEYVNSGDLSLLSELHASSAGLKAYITLNVSEGVEACRKMCGGHGFLVNAGFAELYTSYLPFCTLEGMHLYYFVYIDTSVYIYVDLHIHIYLFKPLFTNTFKCIYLGNCILVIYLFLL